MMTGASGLEDKGQILSVGGSATFNVWQEKSQCDQLSGTKEPSALPPSENIDNFDMLMGIMCRSVRMETGSDKNIQEYSSSVTANRFTMSTQSYELNSENNHCFGANDEVND